MSNKKKKNKGRKILIIFCIILLIIIGYYGSKIQRYGGGVKGLVKATFNLEKKKKLEPINILILGTNENNSDTIMVARYWPKLNKASILSIPRDTFVGYDVNKGGSSDKINAIYPLHGVQAVKTKIEKLTNLEIDKYIVLDTEAIVKIADSIGGIEYDVPIDMSYHDRGQKLSIELKKGPQKLSGRQIEGMLRFRHNDDGTTYPWDYGIEDHGRSRTQREFIKTASKQILQIKNITKTLDIVKIVIDNVKTDLTFNEIKDYLAYAIDFESENLKSDSVPGKDIKTTAWFFLPDKKEFKEVLYRLFKKPEIEEVSEKNIDNFVENIKQNNTKGN